MRIVKVFWALDSSLAYRRHFPAINWLNSYSLYLSSLKPWYDEHLGTDFYKNREQAMAILQEESALNEMVQLVGKDALSAGDQLTLEVAKMIREDFLQQNAFVEIDNFSEYDRQAILMALILNYDKLCRAALEKGANANELFKIPVRDAIGRAKSVPADQYKDVYAKMGADMEAQIDEITAKGGLD
jgi:V/A-type H+-transporting ATPase subunit A